jgi:hypothetical protein
MRRSILATLLTACLGLAACGGEHEEVKLAEVEGIQVSVNHLLYQVQISRLLNAEDVEDRAYLRGIPDSQAELADGEEWFAVFLRVKNDEDEDDGEPRQSARNFVIEDTVGNEYRPIVQDNPFAYESAEIEPGRLIPAMDSAASTNTTNGALLLFKITRASLENRPLEFIIKDPTNPTSEEEEGIVDLDV